ncbi:HTH-type transcriptional regulator BetI [Castellaniella denitrificans]|uniref:TetR/AcrR family transcriptional regulator n=1 Tax=Castellaniella sp. TaxID=1955812 RepID=UPI002AFF4160|nr:TetR/AcrR family transcriptional regulator [Castellaniella sp.]
MPKKTPLSSVETDIAKRRKAQVLDAAIECFRSRGFHQASMSQISAAAGMSSGHIYHYFKSKEDIVAGIVERGQEELSLPIAQAKKMPAGTDVASIFVAAVDEAVALHKDISFAALTMEILAEAGRNPKIADIVQRNSASLHEDLLDLFEDKSHKNRARLEICAALMEGISVRALRNPRLDADLDLDMLRDTMRHVLSST